MLPGNDEPYTLNLFPNYCLYFTLFKILIYFTAIHKNELLAKRGEFNCFIRTGVWNRTLGKLLNAIYHSGDNGNVSLTLTRIPKDRKEVWRHVQLLRKLAASGKKIALEEIKSCIGNAMHERKN